MGNKSGNDGMLIPLLNKTHTGPPVRVDNEAAAEASVTDERPSVRTSNQSTQALPSLVQP